LAHTLLAAGAPAAALEAMAPLVAADGEAWLGLYVETAKRARAGKAPVALLTAELRRDDLAQPAREARVRALLELGASQAAEPYLRDLAERVGGSWVFAYDEALAARGDRAARAGWWRSQGLREDRPRDERRAAVFKLVELRDKAAAEEVLLALAAGAPADGPDVAQLLHLWGPRPSRAALQWVEARARAARGADQAGWLRHLVDLGAPGRAVAVVGEAPAPGDTARFDAWIDALRATRDREGVGRAIERAAAVLRDPARLEALARVALAESLPAAAERAFEAVVSIQPEAPEARRWLGLIALSRNDLVVAREHFERYVAAGGRDPEALLRQGELLERDGQNDAARRAFTRGLEESERAERRTVAARRAHAFLLAHVGRTADAQRDLERLIAEQPADAHLRADYAAWLLKEGRRADAGRVLDLR
jgi:tetratricopeptide (TPR) repeat protein